MDSQMEETGREDIRDAKRSARRSARIQRETDDQFPARHPNSVERFYDGNNYNSPKGKV